jgi:cardiolipin synthase A/B
MPENWVENLVDGHRTFPVLLADLAAARASLHVSIFLFFNDPVGQEIERILHDKARAGVAVRVLVNVAKSEMGDPFSTGEREMMEQVPSFTQDAMDVEALVARLREAGVAVYDSNADFEAEVRTRDPALLDQRERVSKTSRMDAAHVDHRKLVTIDGRVAYCGSANFGAQYLFLHPFDPAVEAKEEARRALEAGGPEPWWKWHDGLVRFEGPVVAEFDHAFRERWVLDGGAEYPEATPVAAGPSPRGVPVDRVTLHKNQPDSTPNGVRKLFLECIAGAEESIFIENPYVYHPAIIEALVAARRARPSLAVDLVVPGMAWNDNEHAQDAMQHHYRALLDAGVRVYEYQNHFTHLKVAAFDGRSAIVGSANLNFRSLEDDVDFELVAHVEGEAFAREVLRVRDADVPASREITAADLGWRERLRDPRTLLLVSRRLL